MRPMLIASLLVLCLLAIGLRSQSHVTVYGARVSRAATAKAATKQEKAVSPRRGERSSPAPRDPNGEREGNWKTTVHGTLQTLPEDAYQSALDEAYKTVTIYLHSQKPPVECTIGKDFVRDRLIKEQSVETPEELEGTDQAGMMRYSLTVAIDSGAKKEIQAMDQEHRMKQRMLLLAKYLAGLFVLLLAVAGYHHLDDRTKGYYTPWLVLGALGAAALTGAGVLLLK